MLAALFWFIGGYIVGGLTPVTFNRIRRKLLSGKLFGKLPEDAPDPTRP